MGAPELPSDSGDDGIQYIQNVSILSDDSESESTDAYEGYQPLAMMDNFEDPFEIDLVENNESMNITLESYDNDDIALSGHGGSPAEESVAAEIERRVWSDTRPQDLQIELDSFRTEQILTAMANISLPNSSVPDWARSVPEERWKSELLQRIRRQNV